MGRNFRGGGNGCFRRGEKRMGCALGFCIENVDCSIDGVGDVEGPLILKDERRLGRRSRPILSCLGARAVMIYSSRYQFARAVSYIGRWFNKLRGIIGFYLSENTDYYELSTGTWYQWITLG